MKKGRMHKGRDREAKSWQARETEQSKKKLSRNGWMLSTVSRGDQHQPAREYDDAAAKLTTKMNE